MTRDLVHGARRVAEFDHVVSRFSAARETFAEEDALAGLWRSGEDARLHEDSRFVRASATSMRWRLSEHRLANDPLLRALLTGTWDGHDLPLALGSLDEQRGGHHVFDPDDARLHRVCDGRWTAVLDELPLRDGIGAGDGEALAEVLSLEAAGGRLDAGQDVEPQGWVALRGQVPRGAFVARIVGSSMEPLLPDKGWALFVPDKGQGKVVLAVHQEFRDAGLVACTVKRAVRDPKGNVCDLRPENPAYSARAILPQGASWDEVRLLASLERPLEPIDFLDLVVPGVRHVPRGPLTEHDLDRRLDGLRGRLAALLEERKPGPGTAPTIAPPQTESGDAWVPPNLLLAAGGQGLRLLVSGWPIPAELRFVSIAGTRIVARNLTREQQIPVPPQLEPYAIVAPDAHEGVLSRLRALAVPGLSPDRATAFFAPERGSGCRLDAGAALRDGRTYRLLVPPSLRAAAEALLQRPWAQEIARLSEWTVLEVELPGDDDPTIDESLRTLGLERAVVGLDLALVGPSPRRLARLPSGAVAPVFATTVPPLVRATAAEPCGAGEVHLLVADATGTRRLALSQGTSWTVELSDLAPGLTIVEARASDREIAHDQLVFLLDSGAEAPAPTSARATLVLGTRTLPLDQRIEEAANLRSVLAAPEGLRMEGPPFWSYDVRWGVEHPVASREVVADEAGSATLPVEDLTAFVSERALAEVSISARELGRARLLHDAAPSVDQLLTSLRALDRGRSVATAGFAGVRELSREWVLPVLRLLGFEVGGLSEADAAVDAPLARLLAVGGQIRRAEVGLVRTIHLEPGTIGSLTAADLQDAQTPPGRLARDLRQRGLPLGILTDGDGWVRIDPLRYVPRRRFVDLRAALDDPYDARLEEFLDVFLE